jgi:dihydroorotate dehydrogenase (NAD+) catalytic subunit
MMNAIGLQNPGIDVFIKRDLEFLKKYDTNIIVNVCGHSIDEYVAVVERLSDESCVSMLEINVSCPNVRFGGIAFGTDPKLLGEVTREVKKHAKQPVIMKLSPNVTSVAEMAKAAEEAGADAISLINTITAMKIDIYRKQFVLANRTGGLSGPAIRPVAVRMVYEASHAVSIPVIGMGGITSGEDAVEFMMAGARAVAVGMYNFHKPTAMIDTIEGIEKYMKKTGIEDINDIVGCV